MEINNSSQTCTCVQIERPSWIVCVWAENWRCFCCLWNKFTISIMHLSVFKLLCAWNLAWAELEMVKLLENFAQILSTALCKSNANVFCRNSQLFLAFRRKNIEFSMEANFQWKVTIICDAYCFQRCEFRTTIHMEQKLFDKWLPPFERNFTLSLLCSNIPKDFLNDNLLSSNLPPWFCSNVASMCVSFTTNSCPFI